MINSNFNHYVDYKPKDGENTDYVAFQDEERNRIILFDSGADMVRCVRQNIENGFWTKTVNDERNRLGKDRDEEDIWSFGYDFPTLAKTDETLDSGMTLEKYISEVEKTREELERVIPKIKTLKEIGTTKRRKRKFDDQDGELDIDRFMSNDPNMFVSSGKLEVKNRIATVFIDVCASCGTDPMQITRNMITATAICEILEHAGISTEIIAAAASQGPTQCTNWYITGAYVKHANEPMDYQRLLTFAVPAVLRYYSFLIWENINHSRAVSGLGTVAYSTYHVQQIAALIEANFTFRGEDLTYDAIRIIVDEIEKFFNMGDLNPELN